MSKRRSVGKSGTIRPRVRTDVAADEDRACACHQSCSRPYSVNRTSTSASPISPSKKTSMIACLRSDAGTAKMNTCSRRGGPSDGVEFEGHGFTLPCRAGNQPRHGFLQPAGRSAPTLQHSDAWPPASKEPSLANSSAPRPQHAIVAPWDVGRRGRRVQLSSVLPPSKPVAVRGVSMIQNVDSKRGVATFRDTMF